MRFAQRMRLRMLAPAVAKACFYAFVLALAVLWGGFFWGMMFFVVALYGYFRSLFDWEAFLYSFFTLTLYAYLGTSLLYRTIELSGTSGFMPVIFASLLFGTLFFLLLGIKEFLFLRRRAIFNFLSGALYFFVASVFFVADKEAGVAFFSYALLSAVVFYILIRESMDFFMTDAPRRKKEVLVAGTALVVSEFSGVISMLPIGFLNSAVLIVLIVFILEDLIYHHLRGSLDRQIILYNSTIFAICILFIFATSKLTL